MAKERRAFSKEFKLQILEEVDDGVPIIELCRRYKLTRSTVWRWQQSLMKKPDDPFPGKGHHTQSDSKKKVAELERMVGRLTMENDFLRSALRRLRQEEG